MHHGHPSVIKFFTSTVYYYGPALFGLVLCGASETVSPLPGRSSHEQCMICTSPNATHFVSWSTQNQIRKGILSETYRRPDYVPPVYAQLLEYGASCDDSQLIGQILRTSETITGNVEGIADAFALLSFADCLITAYHYRALNVSARFHLWDRHNETLLLCFNSSEATLSIHDIPTPWFISPGAIRWATITCAILAILRAFYG
ncbi:ORF4' protein [DeBrazza's monkey arterivirus]|uniref:ORF4' protein n=1 Tax=DeBrazza's monkey arterivirus TaxID=1965063 RepID=A0A0B6C5N8_9NIDO|nr:ORF4' protein [DeBrazza's monkey arterivirus]AJI43728.1 ORF4' protein [DeBrazza's monkey arterivirus]